jgi:ribosomal protein S17E
MFLIMVLGLGAQLVCAADLDTHRDMSFDRSMKGGVAAPAGPQDPVVGKLDPRGLGTRNFVMMIDETENTLMALQDVRLMISALSQPQASFTLDFVGLVQSSDQIILLPRNILDNFRILAWLRQCAENDVKTLDRKYARFITPEVFDWCIKIFTFVHEHHEVKQIENYTDELEKAFEDNKAFFGTFADVVTIDAINIVSDYYDHIKIFEKNYVNFDFYTLDVVPEYVLCVPKTWQKHNQDAVHDVVGGKEQRQAAFNKKIKNIDLYNGVIQFDSLFKKFEITGVHPFDQITPGLQKIYTEQKDDESGYLDHVYDRILPFLKIFVSKKSVNKEFQKYLSFVLPSWNILLGGHGLSKNVTSGLTDANFKTLLDWFEQNIQLQTFLYNSCYPAGQKLKDLFAIDVDRLQLKQYTFPIVATGSTLASIFGVLIENKWADFFDALTAKQYGKAMMLFTKNVIKYGYFYNIFLVKYPWSDRFVTVNIQENESILTDRLTKDDLVKKDAFEKQKRDEIYWPQWNAIHSQYKEIDPKQWEFEVEKWDNEFDSWVEQEWQKSLKKQDDVKRVKNKDFVTLSQVTNAQKHIVIDCVKTEGVFLQNNQMTSHLFVKNYNVELDHTSHAQIHLMPQSGVSDLYHFSNISVQGDISLDNLHTLFTIPGDVGGYIFLVDQLDIVDENGVVKDSIQNFMVINRLTNQEALRSVARALQLHVSDIIDISIRGFSEKMFARNTLLVSWLDSAFYQGRAPVDLSECKGLVRLQDGHVQYQFGEVGQDGDRPMNAIIKKPDVRRIKSYQDLYQSLVAQVPQSAVTQESAAAFEKMLADKKSKMAPADPRAVSPESTVSESSAAVSPLSDDSSVRSTSPVEIVDPAAGALLGVA